MVGWRHQFNGHEFEQTPGDGEAQGSLVCCSLWGRKESDTTERLNHRKAKYMLIILKCTFNNHLAGMKRNTLTEQQQKIWCVLGSI